MKLTISEKIFIILDKIGMSQKEFSEKTGISQSTISDWKRKKTNPASDKIMGICGVLHISPAELLTDEVHPGELLSDQKVFLSREESTLIESYRQLSLQQRSRLSGYISALKEFEHGE